MFAAAFASTTSADVSFLRPWIRWCGSRRLGFVAGAPFVFFQKLPYAMPLGSSWGVAPLLGLVAEAIGGLWAAASFRRRRCIRGSNFGVGLRGFTDRRRADVPVAAAAPAFVDYIPSRVICGLLASIGVELVVAAIGLAAPRRGWKYAIRCPSPWPRCWRPSTRC